MKSDALGDRMKACERMSEVRMMPLLPVFARVDGRAFHSFTKGMERPYDKRMVDAMTATAMALATETNACMVYTQSDEITLAWYSSDMRRKIWFDGRHSKMVSQIAALATLHFYRVCLEIMPDYADRMPSFDARVWQVPTLSEGANVFLWRGHDASKNSVSMAAHAYYSHKELQGKNTPDKHDMLMAKGVNWNDYPAFFKRGVYIQKRKTVQPFTKEEIDKLPERHEARKNPDLVVERSRYEVIDMPPFSKVTNREDVVFRGACPVMGCASMLGFSSKDGVNYE
jgi:tRNA(His) guanylyltransferase